MPSKPETQGPEAAYFANLREGIFALQRCMHCGAIEFPPKDACSRCGGAGLEWQAQPGDGEIYSCTTVRAVEKGKAPYNVSLVALDVGVRLMSTIANIPADDVKIGMRVRARVERDDDQARLVFDALAGADR